METYNSNDIPKNANKEFRVPGSLLNQLSQIFRNSHNLLWNWSRFQKIVTWDDSLHLLFLFLCIIFYKEKQSICIGKFHHICWSYDIWLGSRAPSYSRGGFPTAWGTQGWSNMFGLFSFTCILLGLSWMVTEDVLQLKASWN